MKGKPGCPDGGKYVHRYVDVRDVYNTTDQGLRVWSCDGDCGSKQLVPWLHFFVQIYTTGYKTAAAPFVPKDAEISARSLDGIPSTAVRFHVVASIYVQYLCGGISSVIHARLAFIVCGWLFQ